ATPIWTHDFGPSNITTLPRGIAWSADGRSIFVVAGVTGSTWLHPSYTGPARFFVLDPDREPSSGRSEASNSSPSQQPSVPRPKSLTKAQKGLPIGAIRLATVLGFLVAVSSTSPLRFLRWKGVPLDRGAPERKWVRPRDPLQSTERLVMAEQAN